MGQLASMTSRIKALADPMLAVLIIGIGCALLFPAEGAAQERIKLVSNIGIFVLFLLNGIRVSHGEMALAITNWRYFLPLFIWIFGVMALAGWAMSLAVGNFAPPLIALGFLYLGILPSTIQSATSYTTLAEGNIALAVVGAAVINIAGVFVSAPLFAIMGGGAVADLGSDAIIRIGTILVLPFVIGQILQHWTRDWVIERKQRIVWLDRFVIGLAVYVAFSGAVAQGLAELLDVAGWVVLAAGVVAFLALASFGSWMAGGMLGFDRRDRIAFFFAASQKSVAMGAPLAAILFAPEVGGFLIAPLLLYHLLQLVIAAPIAAYFTRSDPALPRASG